MVIFGATGDLAKRKLLPALYNLNGDGLLPEGFAVAGLGRDAMTTDAYRQKVSSELQEFGTVTTDRIKCEWLESRLSYLRSSDFGDPAIYQRLRDMLAESTEVAGGRPPNYLFYLATPPSLFGPIVEHLSAAGLLADDGGWRRVIIEKPFGHDLDSARALNRRLAVLLKDRQIFRIDHYLGKETVQNIMAFRFANGIFEPIWNRRYIDHVQITVAEKVGVEQRGGYFERAGALRDMVQNHLFQLLALTAMEPPISFEADAVRDERVKVLNAIHPLSATEVATDVVRAQYGASADGSARPYRDEPEVAGDSRTETFVALKLLVDNWRWADVPFYLRTGKRLAARVTEVVIQFKRAPFVLFRDTPVECLPSNQLVLRMQPDEGIALRFEAKVPGPRMRLGTVQMDFDYADYFGTAPKTGYETLLYDAMNGDSTLFHRADIVEAGWTVVDPILRAWAETADGLGPYRSGSWGPPEADALLARDGREWRRP
ncbi:MAG: glucose-6-phosphate dehydrogenase [Acidobacteria bacterium]|nr:glucose-6-phosphate dehydrogenase [Acidobacteriota bacterium]